MDVGAKKSVQQLLKLMWHLTIKEFKCLPLSIDWLKCQRTPCPFTSPILYVMCRYILSAALAEDKRRRCVRVLSYTKPWGLCYIHRKEWRGHESFLSMIFEIAWAWKNPRTPTTSEGRLAHAWPKLLEESFWSRKWRADSNNRFRFLWLFLLFKNENGTACYVRLI